MNSTPEQPLIEPTVVEETPQKSESHLKLIIIVLTVFLIASVSGLAFVISQSKSQGATTVAPSPTVPPPTPTPTRKLSSFATDSAFINFEASVATLSAVTAGYPIFDPSLNPPKLDLPLGFR